MHENVFVFVLNAKTTVSLSVTAVLVLQMPSITRTTSIQACGGKCVGAKYLGPVVEVVLDAGVHEGLLQVHAGVNPARQHQFPGRVDHLSPAGYHELLSDLQRVTQTPFDDGTASSLMLLILHCFKHALTNVQLFAFEPPINKSLKAKKKVKKSKYLAVQ